MHSLSYELQNEGPEIDWAGVFAPAGGPVRRGLQRRPALGPRRPRRRPRPAGVPAALHRRGRPALRRRERERPALEPRLQGASARSSRARWRSSTTDGVRIERFAASPKQAHCFFEWIYFANVASTLDDRSVYLSRAALGKELARLEDVPLDAGTIVVPVPDTAKAAADAMAFELGLPSVEGLMRNRYVGRTFIEGTADRAAKARLKYTPLPEVLAGKRVLLVEDSIVRSTTMRALVHEIRDRGGAREIHLRVACPPIIAPCFYGIDMSSRDELFAPKFVDLPDGGVSEAAQKRMAKELGADSLRYLPGRRDRPVRRPLLRPALPGLRDRPLSHARPAEALPDRQRRGRLRRRRRPSRAPVLRTLRKRRVGFAALTHPLFTSTRLS